ncbi:MAG: anti-sigma factor domain-containing protein [Bacillota bacterium]|nr:anti-sigma factor domain-containing protein [Bacillota bacterium]
MSRGIIMELEGSKAIVLTPTGEFKSTRLPAGKYELGQEVDVKGNYVHSMRKLGAVAAVLIIALLVPYILNIAVLDTKAYAYVDLDINPSVEFTINKQSRIIHARGLNGDGEKVLSDAELVGKSLEYGIEYFALKAIELGFAEGEGKDYILATTVFEGVEDAKLESKIARTLEKVIEKNGIAADMDTLVATKEIKKEADKAGVSSGKFLILLQATEEDVEIDIHDLKTEPAARAIKEAGADIKKIVQDVNSKDADLDELLKKNKDKVLNKANPVPGSDDSHADIPAIPADKRPDSNGNGNNDPGRDKGAPAQGNKENPGERNSGDKNESKNNAKDRGNSTDEKNSGETKNRKTDDRESKADNGKDERATSPGKPRDKAGPARKVKTSGLAEDIIMQLFD